MAEGKKKGGPKTTRSETVTVRLDPRARYLAELAARSQRRTLSSYIEWAVEESLRAVMLDPKSGREAQSVESAAPLLWDLHEYDRLAKLDQLFPVLLTYDEQRLIRLAESLVAAKGLGKYSDKTSGAQSNFVHEHWDALKAAVAENRDTPETIRELIQDPPTVPFIERRIEKLRADIAWLEAKKAELEAAKKNG